MIEQCFGCPAQPVSKLGWYASPCICTTAAETTTEPEPEPEPEPEE